MQRWTKDNGGIDINWCSVNEYWALLERLLLSADGETVYNKMD
jgi:hypothetical protein